jgi:hypothetical protein
MGKVHSLYGAVTGERQVVQSAVEALREMLEMAEAGELIGFAGAYLTHDGCGCYQVAGRVGGYSTLGALETAKSHLVEINRGED